MQAALVGDIDVTILSGVSMSMRQDFLGALSVCKSVGGLTLPPSSSVPLSFAGRAGTAEQSAATSSCQALP